jgi:hypothetical protein
MPKDNLRHMIAELEAYLASELGCRNGMDAAANIPARLQNRLDER